MRQIYSVHSYLRRHLTTVEQVITAAGLAGLLYGLIQFLPAYPQDWGIVLTGAVFFISIWSPVAGYFLAVLAAAYPLYIVSIYLAVIFLAIAIIGQHLFIQNLSGALLTLTSPVLGAIYLSWTVPLLGGLWWGPAGGAIMGGMAALWIEIIAGMAYISPNLLNLLGILPIINEPFRQFSSANSLEVLGILFLPLAPNSSTLLYHLLQIAIWSFTGWMVGMLNEKDWAQIRRPKSSVFIVGTGILALTVLQILLNLWLATPITNSIQNALGYTIFFSFITVIVLEIGLHFFEHPLPVPLSHSAPIQFEMNNSASNTPVSMPVPPLPEMSADDKTEDLIMLELD